VYLLLICFCNFLQSWSSFICAYTLSCAPEHKHDSPPQRNICSQAITADGVQVISALRLATLVAVVSYRVFLSAFFAHSQQPGDLVFADYSGFGFRARRPRFCEPGVHSCIACGTRWLFLMSRHRKSISAAAAAAAGVKDSQGRSDYDSEILFKSIKCIAFVIRKFIVI